MRRRNRHTAWTRCGRFAAVVVLSHLLGCAPELSPPARSGQPIGVQLMGIEPDYRGMPFRVLMDFESPSDLAFIADCPAARLDTQVAHTGGTSLLIPAGSEGFAVKLGSRLASSDFPGGWTLLGAYFIAREASTVAVSYEAEGKVLARRLVALEPRKWTAVFVDISFLSDPNAGPAGAAGALRFTAGRAAVWCDDVMAVDNARPLVGDSGRSGDAWTVRQRGFEILVERPGTFKLNIPTPEADANGWRVAEANELRVCLAGPGGRRTWVIYHDGREYLDGVLSSAVQLSVAERQAIEQQHASPAEMIVPEELGRVERNAPGDRNNDGYAELFGAYQLKANGPRLSVTISPRTPRLVRPVLDVAGLPAGKVLVNLEGQVVDHTVRLPNGHVLVELPATIDRAITVDFHVR